MKKEGKINYTGYWIFLNNPNNWELDRFLEDNINNIGVKLAWTLPEWQKNKFNIGEYGVFRIGKDRRNKGKLAGRKKLDSGVYAIGKVVSLPHLKEKEEAWDNEYNINKDSSYLKSYYCIDLEIVANLVYNPLTFDEIRSIKEIEEDSYLVSGFQSATIPLSKVAFDKILELAKVNKNVDLIETHNSLKNIENLDLTGDERETIIKSRIGHSKFKELLRLENQCCPICGLNASSLLIASHIKPWSKSNEMEKVDKNNGFLLCPNHDYLFDKGFISFDEEGRLLISSLLKEEDIEILGLNRKIQLDLSNEKKEYIKWHREHLYKK